MITYAIMALIMLFLAFELLYKAKYKSDGTHLFDKQNSNAMRGFWCLIVILVHIPTAYQNRIQDMLGSFAYIGVTFFFMTSAYGLRLGIEKNPDSIKCFWRKRLPRLLIPMVLVNVVSMVFSLVEGKGLSITTLIHINGWVQWLMVCYVIFWTVKRFIKLILTSNRGGYSDILVCVLIIVFSVTMYAQKKRIIWNTWCPEVFGFVWGIVFFHVRSWLSAWTDKKWLPKCVFFCILAGIVGIAYLKFKSVIFFGDYLLKILLSVLIITFMLAVNSRIAIGNKVNLFLGSLSYEVYLLHGSVFGLLVAFMPELGSGVFIGLSILITVGISWVLQIAARHIINVVKIGNQR